MLVVNDALDVILVGSFLFGLLFSVGSLLLGFAEFGADHGGNIDHNHFFGALNLSTLLAFLTWFGGVGYIARNGFDLIAPLSIGFGIVGGVAGGALIHWFLDRIIRRDDHPLDPADYRLPGTIARVTSSIRPTGTGEIIYEQAGVRQVAAARSANGVAIPRGTEVVILRDERGQAVVEPWSTFIGERHEDLNPPNREGNIPLP